LQYSVAIVPRHPFPKNFLENTYIPKNITIFNEIGIVRELCAKKGLLLCDSCFQTVIEKLSIIPLRLQ